MKQMPNLVRRLWARANPQQFSDANHRDKRDRSSMADFVPILQAYDRDRQGSIN